MQWLSKGWRQKNVHVEFRLSELLEIIMNLNHGVGCNYLKTVYARVWLWVLMWAVNAQ